MDFFHYHFKRFSRSISAHLVRVSPRLAPLMPQPVPLVKEEYRGCRRNPVLFVLLPGINDLHIDFEKQGFISELRRQRAAADAVAVDAHIGYYASRTLHERLTQDIVLPAQQAGYDQIWLVGISMGGLGAMSYAALHPAHITGLLLLSPYLGGRDLVQEISRAGGAMHWVPGKMDEYDYLRKCWAWLKQHAQQEGAPHLYLGYGEHDCFAQANLLMAEILPSDRVLLIPGAHDWQTWVKLWKMFLATGAGALPAQDQSCRLAAVKSVPGPDAGEHPEPDLKE